MLGGVGLADGIGAAVCFGFSYTNSDKSPTLRCGWNSAEVTHRHTWQLVRLARSYLNFDSSLISVSRRTRPSKRPDFPDVCSSVVAGGGVCSSCCFFARVVYSFSSFRGTAFARCALLVVLSSAKVEREAAKSRMGRCTAK